MRKTCLYKRFQATKQKSKLQGTEITDYYSTANWRKKIRAFAMDVWVFFYGISIILCVFISQFLAKWLTIFF